MRILYKCICSYNFSLLDFGREKNKIKKLNSNVLHGKCLYYSHGENVTFEL